MLRIGIIGTENSHAKAFAKYINLPDEKTGKKPYPNAEVVMVYGPDKDTEKDVMKDGNVAASAQKIEDFFGNVDAMMVTSRWGSVHYKYAKPFIEAGIPIFIDKPLTSDVKEAKELMKIAKENNTLVCGGSGCKYAQDVLDLAEVVCDMKKDGNLMSASLNFTADAKSEYDGLYFYASHLVEVTLKVFGSDIKSVFADAKEDSILVTASYPTFNVAMHFVNHNYKSCCTLYGKSENIYKELEYTQIYEREVDHYMEMISTNKSPQTAEELVLPVRIIDAILRSIETGEKVNI